MQHIWTMVIAAVIGVPLTLLGIANSMSLAHSTGGWIVALLIIPGTLVGLWPGLSEELTHVLFWVVQAIYYIGIAIALRALFFRTFSGEARKDAS